MLLNYAEAKAELGTLTDADWAETIGALRARAGITGGTAQTGTLTTKPTTAEPYIASYYPTISDPVLLEIRREREIELCLEGFRLNDLKRWNVVSGRLPPERPEALELLRPLGERPVGGHLHPGVEHAIRHERRRHVRCLLL